MNNAHIAHYANMMVERYGLETQTVAFWRVYPFEPIELRIDDENSYHFDGKQFKSIRRADFTFDLYITSEQEYVMHFNPDDKSLEGCVVIANSQDDVIRFLTDFEEAAQAVA